MNQIITLMHVNLYNKPNQCRLKRSFINKQVDVTVSLINVDSTTSFTFQKLSIVSYFDDMPVLIEMINNCTTQSLERVAARRTFLLRGGTVDGSRSIS